MIKIKTNLIAQMVQNAIDDYVLEDDTTNGCKAIMPPLYLRSTDKTAVIHAPSLESSGAAATALAIALDAMNPYLRRADNIVQGNKAEKITGAGSVISRHTGKTSVSEDTLALWTLRALDVAYSGSTSNNGAIGAIAEAGSPIVPVTTGAAMALLRHESGDDIEIGGCFCSKSRQALKEVKDGSPCLDTIFYINEKVTTYKSKDGNDNNRCFVETVPQRFYPNGNWGTLGRQPAVDKGNRSMDVCAYDETSDGYSTYTKADVIDWGSRTCKTTYGLANIGYERDKDSTTQAGPVMVFMDPGRSCETIRRKDGVQVLAYTSAFRAAYAIGLNILTLQSVALFMREFMSELATQARLGNAGQWATASHYGDETAAGLSTFLSVNPLQIYGYLRPYGTWTVDKHNSGRNETMSTSHSLTNVSAQCTRHIGLDTILNSGTRGPYGDGTVPSGQPASGTTCVPCSAWGGGCSMGEASRAFRGVVNPELRIPLWFPGFPTEGPGFNCNGAPVDCPAAEADAPSIASAGLVASAIARGRTGHVCILMNDKDPDVHDWYDGDWVAVLRQLPGTRTGDMTGKFIVTGGDK